MNPVDQIKPTLPAGIGTLPSGQAVTPPYRPFSVSGGPPPDKEKSFKYLEALTRKEQKESQQSKDTFSLTLGEHRDITRCAQMFFFDSLHEVVLCDDGEPVFRWGQDFHAPVELQDIFLNTQNRGALRALDSISARALAEISMTFNECLIKEDVPPTSPEFISVIAPTPPQVSETTSSEADDTILDGSPEAMVKVFEEAFKDLEEARGKVREDLQSRQEAFVEFLLGQDQWITMLTAKFSSRRKEALTDISKACDELGEVAEQLDSQVHLERMEALQEKYQQVERAWFRAMTQELLSSCAGS